MGGETNIMEVLGVASVGGLGAFEWVDPGQLMGNLLTKSHGQKCKCLDNMDHFHHLIARSLNHIILWRLICCIMIPDHCSGQYCHN